MLRNVTVFEYRDFKDVNKLKFNLRLLGWTLLTLLVPLQEEEIWMKKWKGHVYKD